MPAAPAPLSLSPEKPLKFVGGDPSVDFVNTVDWTSRGLDHDRIPDYARLTRWAEEAGVITGAVGDRLRRAAASRPREAATAYAAATWLRWVLQRLFTGVAANESPGVALEEFNDLLADTLGHLRLGAAASRRHGRRITWEWSGMGEDLASPLWPVVRGAAELLASDEIGRIRVCDAPECGWLYVDRSRNGLRRWCQMETCGTRAKNLRRRGN